MPLPALITASLITGGASLAGGLLTNASNRSLANSANALTQEQFDRSLIFNEQQAALARQFSAHEAGVSRRFNAEQAALNRTFSAREAAKARSWYEGMSNTAHQREVKDLRAAGLNPILSANSGAPVSASPSAAGSAASAQAAQAAMASASGGGSYHAPTMQNALGDAISTGMDVYTGGQNVKESMSRVEKNAVEIESVLADIPIKEQTKLNLVEKLTQIKAEITLTEARRDKTWAESGRVKTQHQMERILFEYYNTNEMAIVLKDMGLINLKWYEVSNWFIDLYNTIDAHAAAETARRIQENQQ